MLKLFISFVFILNSTVAVGASSIKAGVEREWQIVLPDRQVFALKKEYYKDMQFYSAGFKRGQNELKNRTLENKKGDALLKTWSNLFSQAQKVPSCPHPTEVKAIKDTEEKIAYLCLQSLSVDTRKSLEKYLKEIESSIL